MSQAPGSLEEVPYQFISREEELESLVTELSQCSEFAIDLEVGLPASSHFTHHTCSLTFTINMENLKHFESTYVMLYRKSCTKNEGLPCI